MLADLKAAKSEQEIKDVEVKYFGRQGLFNEIMKSLKDLSVEDKQTVGKLANMTKKEFGEATQKRYGEVEHEKLSAIAEDEVIVI